jgi:hypothetical protein
MCHDSNSFPNAYLCCGAACPVLRSSILSPATAPIIAQQSSVPSDASGSIRRTGIRARSLDRKGSVGSVATEDAVQSTKSIVQLFKLALANAAADAVSLTAIRDLLEPCAAVIYRGLNGRGETCVPLGGRATSDRAKIEDSTSSSAPETGWTFVDRDFEEEGESKVAASQECVGRSRGISAEVASGGRQGRDARFARRGPGPGTWDFFLAPCTCECHY